MKLLGEDGYTDTMVNNNGQRRISPMQFYCYRLMVCDDNNLLLWFGRLLQQYIVDMYVKMEKQRLNYIRDHQAQLRCDLYSNVVDAAISGNDNMNDIGRRVILASSFIGGPRHMQQLYMDAMDIVRRFGKPDLFITFTCNPMWVEIQRELKDHQQAPDRPDIVSRVFHMKVKSLMKDLTSSNVLGKVIAHIHVIEFQKRGLPHAHILLILAPNDKILPSQCDSIVSAEIPDASIYPEAHRVVTTSMMHGPCGPGFPNAVCMENGRCSKGFPKQFAEETSFSESGYSYRRRNNGASVSKSGVNLDNRWVVPYNLYLCSKYNAHLNVKVRGKKKPLCAVFLMYLFIFRSAPLLSL